MKSLPCPRCGKKATAATFCSSCLRELHPLVDRMRDVKVTFCVKSGRVKIGTGWESLSPQEAIQKAVEKAIVPKEKVVKVVAEHIDIQEFLQKPGINRILEVKATVTGSAQGLKEYDEEYVVLVNLLTTISPKYAKIGTHYFEGILQLRNEMPNRVALMKKLVLKQDGLAINKEIPVKNGTDYEFTDKQRMRQIAHILHNRFGGVLKENARLITHDKMRSKDVHRLTVFIEFPPFEKGALLQSEEDLVIVEKLGKKMIYRKVITGKKKEGPYDPSVYQVITPKVAKVIQEKPHLAIIDPETFQLVPLYWNGYLGGALNVDVLVAKHKGRWWSIAKPSKPE